MDKSGMDREGNRGHGWSINSLPGGGSRLLYSVVGALMIIHASMLAWGAVQHSPCWDEVGHLVAGISHWQFGRFDLYRVNPPLVRSIAALPVVLAGPETDWSNFSVAPQSRPEFGVGRRFMEVNGERSFWLYTLARWVCIPFSLLGAYICFQWARELYGHLAGVLAVTLWCFAPNIIAHGQLITPDVGATALGVAAAYVFWKWLKRPSGGLALAAGVVLGLVELTKMTWVVLFPLWPLLWLVWRWPLRRDLSRHAWFCEGRQMGLILLMGLYVINLGYGFEGTFQKLGDYKFVSHALGGYEPSFERSGISLNRFNGSWLGEIPVPLPKHYLMGIDLQKRDFERKMWSYLRSEWREGGWWYYYFYALAIKVPLGTWLLIVLVSIVYPCLRSHSTSWRDELILLVPAGVVLTLVSSQTGFNHHLRYVLPILPFVFIWVSKVARAVDLKHWKIASLAAVALLWSIGSSLWVYPHSLSYFNELVGGPKGGHYHLGNSNIDWGQDLLYLKRWLDEHPEARPLTLAYDMPLVDPKLAGIDYTGRPPANFAEPGWHAVSVNQIHSRSREYEYFLRFEPFDMVGYSIYIYHITLDEANRVRRERGLPELPDP